MGVNWIKASASGPEIWVYDDIAFWGTTADGFRRELAAIGPGPLTVRINSGGGNPFDAVAIANLLWERGDVTTQVDGVAASAASVILMGGHTRRAAANAWVMIHNPTAGVVGDENDLALAIRRLASVRASLIHTYSKRSGQSENQIIDWMDEEKWWKGALAKDAGMVDEVTDTMTFSARADLSKCKHLPESLRSHSGRQQPLVTAETATTTSMSVIADFIKRVKGEPSPVEAKAKALIKGLGIDDESLTALLESKDDSALSAIVDGAIEAKVKEATAERDVRLVKVSDALKASGFDVEKIDTFKADYEARVEEAASKKALSITASRGVKPVATTAAAAGGTTGNEPKGRDRVVAAIEAELAKNKAS